MAVVDVTLYDIFVYEAGEDGADMDAEWRLSFTADGADLFVYSDNAVTDNEWERFYAAPFSLNDTTIRNLDVGDTLEIRAYGHEVDAFNRQDLPEAARNFNLSGLPIGYFSGPQFVPFTAPGRPATNENFSYDFLVQYTVVA